MKKFKLKLVRETNDNFDLNGDGRVRFICSSDKCRATNFLSPSKYSQSTIPMCRICGSPLIDPHEKVAVSKPKRNCKRCGCNLSISNHREHCRPCQESGLDKKGWL